MIVAKETVLNIGTSNLIGIAANQARKLLIIQNKHATQTLRVAFGTPVIADVVQVQDIDFSTVPDAGAWKITYDGVESASLANNISAAALQTALRLLTGLSAITVAGDFTAGFTITMTSATQATGKADLPIFVISANTLTTSAVAVAVTVVITTQGTYANGVLVAAANGIITLQGDSCPIDSINLLASGAGTRAEIIEG